MVADMKTPTGPPGMKKAAAIVTNRGGGPATLRLSRESSASRRGGCGDATTSSARAPPSRCPAPKGHRQLYEDGSRSRSGNVDRNDDAYSGQAQASLATEWLRFSGRNDGCRLARLEFVINNLIGVHPKAVLDYPDCRLTEAAGRTRRTRLRDSGASFHEGNH